MLRYRKYLIAGGCLLLLLAYLLPGWIATGNALLSMPKRIGNVSLEQAHTSIAYRLEHETWLEFPIPAASEQIKIVSNASIPVNEATLPDTEWRYALRYQVVGQQGKILDERIYHHRTHITRYVHADGQGSEYRSYFIDTANVVADGRQMLMDISQLVDVHLLRLRLESRQPQISELVVRAYAPEKIAEHKLAASWQRMSAYKKNRLAKGNVYPVNLLSEGEKRNLLRKQWRPIGPNGLDGTHYFPKMLYSFSVENKPIVREEILPVGLEIDALHHGVIPIPEYGGGLRLELHRLDSTKSNNFDTLVQLSWYGRTAQKHWQNTIVWSGEKAHSSIGHVDGGYLLVQSAEGMILRAFLRVPGSESEITPGLITNRLYLGKPDIPVEYAIHHSGLQDTPVKIDVRWLFEGAEGNSMKSADVDFELLDEQRRVIKTGSLALPDRASYFDRLRGDFANYRVSDPAHYYISIPPAIAFLRLSHSVPALVNVYNRPKALQKLVRVPEDAFPVTVDSQPLPSWFMLRPSNLRELTVNRRTALLSGQSRPRMDRLQQFEQAYFWQSFKPESNRGSDFALTPRNPDDPREDQVLGSIFCEVPTAKEVSLNLQAHGELRSIKPQLVYLQDWAKPFVLKVSLDGRFLHRADKIARQGIANLPFVASGLHRLRLDASNSVRFYMNHITSCSKAMYLKRRIHRLGPRDLAFNYRKSSPGKETLSARLYTDYKSRRRTVVEVRIQGIKRPPATLFKGWTFKTRRYDIRAADGKPAYTLQSTPRILNAGQAFFVPLAEDLPPGDYRVTFSLPEKHKSYLSLISRRSGKIQQYWIYRDSPAFASQN